MSKPNDPFERIARAAAVLELNADTVLRVWDAGLQFLNGSLPCPECGAKLAPHGEDEFTDEFYSWLLLDLGVINAASKGPWRAGSGYEQSDRGNYIADAIGLIVCAEQDGTDCVLRTSDRNFIARFDPKRARQYVDLTVAVKALRDVETGRATLHGRTLDHFYGEVDRALEALEGSK